MPVPFEIVQLQPHGQAASNGQITVCLAEPDGRIFRRRAIKAVGTPEAHQVDWAVAELDGVRVYVDGGNVIVTRRDMYP